MMGIDWRRILDAAPADPSVGQVAEALVDATDTPSGGCTTPTTLSASGKTAAGTSP